MKITIVMNLLCDTSCDALKDIDTICPKVDEVLGNFSSDKPSLIITFLDYQTLILLGLGPKR
jgi:hypothetical protein